MILVEHYLRGGVSITTTGDDAMYLFGRGRYFAALEPPHYPVPATLAVGQTYWQQQQRLGNWLPNT